MVLWFKIFLSLSNITHRFTMYTRIFWSLNNFKVFPSFSEISCLSFTSNQVFYFSQVDVFIGCHLSKIYLQSERKASFYLVDFLFQKPNFSEKKEKYLSIFVKSLSNKHEHKLFHRYNFRSTYLKEHLLVAASIISIERLKNMCKWHIPS